MQALRDGCAIVAARARYVTLDTEAIAAYAASLPVRGAGPVTNSDDASGVTGREQKAAFWMTLDAVNFGSGWFPTLRKPAGRSGYQTIAAALSEHARRQGVWTARELAELDATTIARVLGQDPEHELMALYADSLTDLGTRVDREHGGRFALVVDGAARSAVALARRLGAWRCFADCSRYDELALPFLKRAQITAADLARAGVAAWTDFDRLTMFADNLVPHVLRLDGILHFDPELVTRIDRGQLIAHGSQEEIEIRACAVHAVELIVAAAPQVGAPAARTSAAAVDELLWNRGQEPRYKASARHRTRCTAY